MKGKFKIYHTSDFQQEAEGHSGSEGIAKGSQDIDCQASTYQFKNDHEVNLDEDLIVTSPKHNSAERQFQRVGGYRGFKGIKEQISDMKVEYESDKMHVANEVIVKGKGLRFLKKV